MASRLLALPVVSGFRVATLNTDTFKLDSTSAARAETQRSQLHDYDMLCINSVFSEDMVQEWTVALKEQYPYSYVPPSGASKCGCPAEQYEATLPKFLANPSLASAPELFKVYGSDYYSCSTCFFNLYDGTDGSVSACNLGEVPMLPETGCFVNSGAMGNFVLSRVPLVDSQHRYFERATTIRRGGISTTVEVQGERHQLFCTHLQDPEYDRRAYPYDGMTWNDENEWNGRNYLDFADDVADPVAHQYLAGDFNVGPGLESRFVARPRDTENNVYSSVLARGWRNAYLEKSEAQCGICFDNPRSASSFTIRNISVPHASQHASHIFTKNVDLTDADSHRVAVGPLDTALGLIYVTDKYGIGLVTKPRCDVVVVGGGIAGLATAAGWKVSSDSGKVCLVESESRTGGRLHDKTFDGAPGLAAGMGGWYFGQGSSMLLALAAEHDIALEPFEFEKQWISRGIITDDWRQLASQFAVPDDIWSHESPEAWKEARMGALAENLETFGTYSMLLQRALGSEGASFYALWRGTPSGFTSTIEPKSVYDERDKWTGNTIFGPNGSFGMVRPIDGMSAFTAALRKKCELLGVEFHTGSAVERIDVGDSGYVMHLGDGSELLAGSLVLAVPPSALAKIGGLAQELVAAPEFKGIDIGLSFKGTASFSSPWWEACGLRDMGRVAVDPATACLGSVVPYAARHDGDRRVLHMAYVNGFCAERYAALHESLSREAFDQAILNELRTVFAQTCPNVTVPKPLETEYACWACKGTGWGVSQRGLRSNGEAISQKDVMNWAAAPLSKHVGRLFLVGSDYSVESGWAEGAMASSACALWHARGVPVYDQAEWARRDYCDLGSRAFLV